MIIGGFIGFVLGLEEGSEDEVEGLTVIKV